MQLKDYLNKLEINYEKFENYCKKNKINIKQVEDIFQKIYSRNFKYEKYLPLLNWVTQQFTTGFIKDLKKKNAWNLILALIIAKSSNEYPASIIYSAQTKDKGLGYYFSKEKISENELIKWIEKHLNSFYKIQWFSQSEGYLYEICAEGEIGNMLKEEIENLTLDKYGFSFEKIAVYYPETISKKKDKENLLIRYPNLVLFFIVDYLLIKLFLENKKPSFEDFAEIFIVSNRLRHRRHFIFPNISEIYFKFYSNKEDFAIVKEKDLLGEDIEEKILGSKLARLVISLWIKHPDYSEESLNLLDKLVYYLFNYVKLNGEILDKSMILLIKYCLKENVKKKILYLDYVLKKFWDIANMQPSSILSLSESIGRRIVEKCKKKYNLDNERAKKRLKRVIDDLKVEKIPGRFFEKLVLILRDYEIEDEKIITDIKKLLENPKIKNNMDNFFYVKALILSGLLNSL